jgi:hypothetical protein
MAAMALTTGCTSDNDLTNGTEDWYGGGGGSGNSGGPMMGPR